MSILRAYTPREVLWILLARQCAAGTLIPLHYMQNSYPIPDLLQGKVQRRKINLAEGDHANVAWKLFKEYTLTNTIL